jgi:N-acyl-D-amino-acid deacylase
VHVLFDILFRGAKIVDGSGAPWYRGDVGVNNGRIAAVGKLSKENANQVIDVCDRVLCPGFIDVHTHSDFIVFRDPVMLPKLRQGVTTQMVGQCGQSAAPVNEKYAGLLESYLGFIMAGTKISWNWKTFDEWLKEVEKLPLAVNMATCLGHGTLRAAVMGFEDREATPEEMGQMKAHMREAMEAGSFGLTSGLIYPPGVYAPKEEMWSLAEVLAETGGLYLTHMRGESGGLLEAVAETIELGRRAGIPVQISHHKALGKDNWGLVTESLKMVDKARAEGIDVTIDQYPYNNCSTSVRACLPPWAQAGGVHAICDRLADPGTRAKIAEEIKISLDTSKPCGWESMLRHGGGAAGALVVYCPNTPQWEGKNLHEISAAMNVDPVEAAFRIIESNKGSDLACYAAIGDEDIKTVLGHPATMVGADSIPPADKHCDDADRQNGSECRGPEFLRSEFPVNEDTYEEAVYNCNRAGFIGSAESSIDSYEDDCRASKSGNGDPGRGQEFLHSCPECAGSFVDLLRDKSGIHVLRADEVVEDRIPQREQQSGDNCRQEQGRDRLLCEKTVDQRGNTWRDQVAEEARGAEKGSCIFRFVSVLFQTGDQQRDEG